MVLRYSYLKGKDWLKLVEETCLEEKCVELMELIFAKPRTKLRGDKLYFYLEIPVSKPLTYVVIDEETFLRLLRYVEMYIALKELFRDVIAKTRALIDTAIHEVRSRIKHVVEAMTKDEEVMNRVNDLETKNFYRVILESYSFGLKIMQIDLEELEKKKRELEYIDTLFLNLEELFKEKEE